ncbi:uncharacterized protein H6S33_000658 [Morchella sextelata]|uniref:uncharacterized protein n=1 Tax=Morchella sextelata TaxID=1174677 RepID=UPI001D036877|nr:uncharacterized protein H6S33_000658 [Morchella sextelata]KAH0615022.1 hypothetical protein H6S33_000658 [Morchella sextelata]
MRQRKLLISTFRFRNLSALDYGQGCWVENYPMALMENLMERVLLFSAFRFLILSAFRSLILPAEN